MKWFVVLVFINSFVFTNQLYSKTKSQIEYGIIDMQKIILSVQEGKKARTKLQEEIKAKETALLKEQKEIDILKNDLIQRSQQLHLLSESARNNLFQEQKELEERFKKLKISELSLRKEITIKEQKVMQKIAEKVSKITEVVAKQEKLDIVFERSSAGILYMRQFVDLTDRIIKKYEKVHRVKKKNKKSTANKK